VPDAGRRPHRTQAGRGRDEDLPGPAERPQLQPPGGPEDAAADGHTRADRLLEPDVGVPRMAPAAVRGSVEAVPVREE